MPNESDWTNWDASPNLAPSDLLAKSPKSWIAVAELDILCEEGKTYGELLRKAGVETELQVIPGSTHSILILDGKSYSLLLSDTTMLTFFKGKIVINSQIVRFLTVHSALKLGRKLVQDASEALAEAFGTKPTIKERHI